MWTMSEELRREVVRSISNVPVVNEETNTDLLQERERLPHLPRAT